MRAELPASINWLYSFGFKVGIFITLKSFLMLVNQYRGLSIWGFVMIAAQLAMGFVWLLNGPIMQDMEMYKNSNRLKSALTWYGWAALVGAAVVLLRMLGSHPYYRNPESVNWFVDFFSGAYKGMKDVGATILFCDNSLWGFFAVTIYLIGRIYHNSKFDEKLPLLPRVPKRRAKERPALPDEEASA